MDDNTSGKKLLTAIKPVAIGTTGTGQTGKIIDRKGYVGAVMFAVSYGEITATSAVYTVVVREGDATGAMTSAADIDLIGTEAAAGLAAGARTSGTGKNVVKKVGYKGGKRYCSISVRSTATAGTLIAANAILEAGSKPAA